MAISDWDKDKVFKFTIDNTELTEDVDNFPVLVTLDAGCGKNNFDASDIFEELYTINEGNDSNTLLLIHGQGTVGTNTFIDSSADQIDLTVEGAVVYTDSVVKIGPTSLHFTTNLDKVYGTTTSVIGTGDFTAEIWFRTTTAAQQNFFNILNGVVYMQSNRLISWYHSGTNKMNSTTYLSLNAWYHIALIRTGTTTKLYINGVQEDSFSDTTDYSSGYVRLGDTTNYIRGYVQEARVSNVARWAANFTPPTRTYGGRVPQEKKIALVYPSVQEHPGVIRYQYDANTKFILRSHEQYNGSTDIEDSSNLKQSITVYGGLAHSSDQAIIGNTSVYFDGTDDYISLGSGTDYQVGTNDFTIHWWEYRIRDTSGQSVMSFRDTTLTTGMLLGYGGAHLFCYMSSNNSSWDVQVGKSLGTLVLSVWSHRAVVRKGSNFYYFKDGTLTDTGTSSLSIANPTNVTVGRNGSGYQFKGYIEDFVFINGTALWTEDFPIPTRHYGEEEQIATYIHGDVEQCYCEVEDWDTYLNKALLWVKIPKILAEQPTEFYLYYDSNQTDNTEYIGNVGDWASTQVWSDNFVAVHHMNQKPAEALLDSTSNVYNATPVNMDGAHLVDGKVNKAIDFTTSNDYVNLNANLSMYTSVCHSLWVKPDNVAQARHYLTTVQADPPNLASFTYQERQGVHLATSLINAQYFITGNVCETLISTTNLVVDEWSLIHFCADPTGGKLYLNGKLEDSSTAVPVVATVNEKFLGARLDSNGSDYADAKMSEVRIAQSGRSSSWVKSDYLSTTDNFLTITSGTKYNVSGYVTEYGEPVIRTVYLYDRSSGELMDKAVSNSLGYYTLNTTFSGTHNMVCLDAAAPPDFEDLIISKVTPTEVIQ